MLLDPKTLLRCHELQNKLIKFDLHPYPIHFYWGFSDKGFKFYKEHPQIPDLIIQSTPFALLRSLQQKIPFNAEVILRGDTALAQRVKILIQEIEIDWEEILAKIIGDPIAHGLSRITVKARNQAQKFLESLKYNIPEYLQEESKLLVNPFQVEDFYNAITKLSLDIDRLEKRIDRLSSHLVIRG